MRSFIGERFLIRIPAAITGKDLQHMIALQAPQKPSSPISLQRESKKLLLRRSLKEQGFHGEVTLYDVYTQVDLLAAWKYLIGNLFLGVPEKPVDDEEIVLEGITGIDGIKNLTLYCDFNQRVMNVILPVSLQSLTFLQQRQQTKNNKQQTRRKRQETRDDDDDDNNNNNLYSNMKKQVHLFNWFLFLTVKAFWGTEAMLRKNLCSQVWLGSLDS